MGARRYLRSKNGSAPNTAASKQIQDDPAFASLTTIAIVTATGISQMQVISAAAPLEAKNMANPKSCFPSDSAFTAQ